MKRCNRLDVFKARLTESSGSNPVSSCRLQISARVRHARDLKKDAVTACVASDGGLQLRHSDIACQMHLQQSKCTSGAAIASFC
jgi:hypothetical protein